jgi:hypothetical protein
MASVTPVYLIKVKKVVLHQPNAVSTRFRKNKKIIYNKNLKGSMKK